MKTRRNGKRKPSLTKKVARRAAWGVVAAGTAYVASRGAQVALARGYEAARGKEAPPDPLEPGTSWRAVIGWSIATAVVVGLVQVFAQRAAAEGWTYATGHRPPN
jgi:hypothetical protein